MTANGDRSTAKILTNAEEGATLKLWSMTVDQRLARQLDRAKISRDKSSGGLLMLLRGDYVYEDVLLTGMAQAASGTVLVDEDEKPVAALISLEEEQAYADFLQTQHGPGPDGSLLLTAADIGGRYNKKLRKREDPILRQVTLGKVDAIERRLYHGAYKGVTDLVTKYLWPEPALHVTRLCSKLGLSPNMVTSASFVLVLAAMYLFWIGAFGWGLVAAWGMTFLDTVDGKLARVTLTSSPFGNVFDHGIDLIHPPFWYWAWAIGCMALGFPLENFTALLSVIVGGYIFQRLQEGVFMTAFGMEMHIWRPFDSAFRLITARRNPNLLILTASVLFARPDLGLLAVAWWTVLSIAVHMVQIFQAMMARRRGDKLVSWLAQ